MKRTLLYLLSILALVACKKDPDVILTTVVISNEVFTPSYTTAIVQCNITCSNSTIDMYVLYSPSADMTDAQEVNMEKQGNHYEATLTGLQDETTYYIRYKASNKLSSLMAKQTNEFKTLTPSIPEVRLVSISNVLDSSAIAEINLVTDGGAEVSQYGICWSTGEMPTQDDAHCETQQLQSSYSLKSLLPNTKYYVRAYAVNKKGIAYSEAKSLLTYALPCVETKAITNIQKTGCKLNGEVTFNGNDANYVTGFCWSTKSQPTISDNCTTMAETSVTFSHNLTNLKAETTYYVRAFSKNKIGLVYGNELTFTTKAADKPTITTSSVTNISYTSATCGGNVTDDGGASVTERGVCYSTTTNPTTSNSVVKGGSGTGSFTCSLTGLADGTTYYVRAYATNTKGTSYGEVKTITTTAYTKPTITTSNVTNISYTSATCGGSVTSDGGQSVTERGICYATTSNPTTSNTKVTSGTGTGSFSCNLTGLTAGTTYYVRAYAINSKGTSYGEVKSFTTTAYSKPTITTSNVTNISYTSATCGGNVTADGGQSVTERGICYATTTNPTISNTKVTSGTGTGSYSCNLTGLKDGTTYYVRAYAINSKGISYGEVESFTTTAYSKPTITTSNVTNISYTSATCGGDVTDDGGQSVTERGICYSTSSNPTTSSTKIISGSGTGSFSCSITGLEESTTYYVRAYAINSQGINYGSQVSFKTQDPYGGHEYIDLGLSVNWATHNIGASSPDGYGNYYSWSETSSVVSNWGKAWKMPSRAEFNELLQNSTKTWTSNYNNTGKSGYIFTSDIEGYVGNAIFLPCSGYRHSGTIDGVGTKGIYWTSTQTTNGNNSVTVLSFESGTFVLGSQFDLYYGLSIRPVCSK